MDRNREARRASSIVGSNGFNRRRHRTNSLRDSPDEDGGVELQESVRLRERVKKDRDRDRERERESLRERDLRERDRDLRERSSRNHNNHNNSNKRRRAERLATSNREDINIGGVDETSEESVNDEEDDNDNDNDNVTAARLPVGSLSNHNHQHHHSHLSGSNHHYHSSSVSQQHNNISTTNNNNNNNTLSSNSNHNHHHHLQHRKSYPPPTSSTKAFRAPTSSVWKPADEMIGVPVPRKARSASTKRSHDWISSSSNNNSGGVGGGEQILRQTSGSPVGPGLIPSPVRPMSPSSSNISTRKKLKPSGSNSGVKLKPPKVSSSSKPSTSNPEELEIEIAEVLYGLMTQSQGPSSKKDDSFKEAVNRSSSDAKSRNSSPVSNSASANNNPVLGSNSSPLSAVAPKRKRPRQVPENPSYGARSSPIAGRPDTDPTPKSDISAPNLERVSGPAAENGGNMVNSQAPVAQPTALELARSSDLELKPVPEESKESNSYLGVKEEVSSPKEKEVRTEDSSTQGTAPTISTATTTVAGSMVKGNSTLSQIENQKEEKFEIDLMAPPPQARSSPERETKADLNPVLSLMDAEMKPVVVLKDKDEETGTSGTSVAAGGEEKKDKVEEGESSPHNNGKGIVENKGRNIDLQLDLEKFDRDGSAASVSAAGFNAATANRLQMQTQKQQQQIPVKATRDEPLTDKPGLSVSSVPLPMSMAGWPGGLPPMGYMAPLQGVVSMDGTTVTQAPIQPLFFQPRPKRCATHCHIARNILYHQQFMKMNSFWPAAPGSASLFGSKTCNLNVVQDLQGNGAVRGVNNAQESSKGQNLASVSSNGIKDKGGSSQQGSTISDSAQRKPQLMIQQALPPVAPSNLLGPAFIFPLNQQQAAAAAAVRPAGAGKTPTTGSVASAASSSSAASASASATAAPAGGVANAMSFNYPNIAAPNETQYLAILQNNYPFPIPAVGAPPNYRGAPAQAMSLFNGSFYSSQMIHPSQLQNQQQPPPQSTQQQQPQLLQTHQNASASSGGSSSSQKHQQQQRPQSSSGGPGSVNLQNFPSQKPSQHLNQQMNMSRPKPLENESGGEDTQANDNSRGSRASVNIYGQNFAMPIHPQNYALMTQQAALAASGSGTNQGEKKSHHQGLKSGVDGLPPHSFAMSFGPINGTSSGIDMASMAQAQNHALFQNSQEVARQNFQVMAAAAAAAAQKKSFKISEDGKSGGGESSSAIDDERKGFAANKPQAGGGGQSIAFNRSDLSDSPVTSNSAAASGPARSSSRSVMVGMNAMNAQNAQMLAHFQQQQLLMKHQQQQHQQQQHQQLQHQHQQQQMAASRSKVPVTSNGSMYSEHLNSSSSMAAKFPNALSGFPQNLVSSNNSSPSQSPQWKGSTSTRGPTSQVSSAAATALKNNLPQQQHSRTQTQMQTHISFGGNQKTPPTSQGQQPTTNSNQAPSPPMMVGSPTTSSLSKGGASGSPRTSTSVTTNNKTGQASPFSAQQPKNSPSMHSQKSPSILGNPQIVSSSSGGAKPQMQQQSSQPQQLPKNMQQGQLFFSNPYTQAQSTNTATSGPGGYYMQRRRQDQPPQGGPATSSTGVLSLSSAGTNDPAKAIAAATSNVKGGGGMPPQSIIHASQFAAQAAGGTLLPAGFSYPIPAAVQGKPAEQKQPAGNDLHPWQPEKK